MKTSDFLVIGAGVAGLSFALRAAEHGRVAVITKGKFLDCSSAKAQGGIAAVWDHDDSFEDHVADTLDAGAGLCNEQVVRTIVEAVSYTHLDVYKRQSSHRATLSAP